MRVVLVLAALMLFGCNKSMDSDNGSPPPIEGGGSATKVAQTPRCIIYRVFLPEETRPVYVTETRTGWSGSGCGIVQ